MSGYNTEKKGDEAGVGRPRSRNSGIDNRNQAAVYYSNRPKLNQTEVGGNNHQGESLRLISSSFNTPKTIGVKSPDKQKKILPSLKAEDLPKKLILKRL